MDSLCDLDSLCLPCRWKPHYFLLFSWPVSLPLFRLSLLFLMCMVRMQEYQTHQVKRSTMSAHIQSENFQFILRVLNTNIDGKQSRCGVESLFASIGAV